jgi:Skp family chaperone for outer membrane proteins
MRQIEKLFLFAGVALAVTLSVGSHLAGTPAIAHERSAPRNATIATVDAYFVTDKLFASDELRKAREDLGKRWQDKMAALESDLRALEQQASTLSQTDPKLQELARQAQSKQDEYRQSSQQGQQEIEKLNSDQLIAAYNRTAETAKSLADKLGYTHIISTRSADRPIQTVTGSATLQEMLARPLIRGSAEDDLTKQVLAELKLDASPTSPAPAPAATPGDAPRP